jgi:hypothetical protein
MTCHFDPDVLLAAARGAADPRVDAHVVECPSCAARLARERELTAGLRGLGRATADARPSPALEGRLLAAFAARHQAERVTRRGWLRPGIAAAAALAALAVVVAGLFAIRDDGQRGRLTGGDTQAAFESEFHPWPGAETLPAFESGQLVRMELPASVLPLLGIVPAMAITTETVEADVLVGQDGLARAVRFAP